MRSSLWSPNGTRPNTRGFLIGSGETSTRRFPSFGVAVEHPIAAIKRGGGIVASPLDRGGIENIRSRSGQKRKEHRQ